LRAERNRLRRELALRNSALDATSSHFLIMDVRQRGSPIVYANRAVAIHHGYQPQELIGRSPEFLTPKDLNPQAILEARAAVRAGASLRTQLRARRKDNSIFWTGIALTPIRDESGSVAHYVAIGADITSSLEERAAKERLQQQLYAQMRERERMAIELRLAQKLESVGRLAAGVAHEINTPIQYVGDSIAFLQTAMRDLEGRLAAYEAACHDGVPDAAALQVLTETRAALDREFLQEEIPRSFERTVQGIERVAAIVRAMKEFAHPDSTEQSLADVNHALRTTLIVAHNEYKYVAQIETDLKELPEVMCNVGELNQVFLNLIVNAAHAIEAAGRDAAAGRIRIGTSATESEVRVRIADNGCGIPAENLERIFDPFFTTKEVGKGTGQGLAIARSIIIDKHRGTIDVESTPGVGTTFSLGLPIAGNGTGAAV
jgi:two-component system, NtrC family, sensor kinase